MSYKDFIQSKAIDFAKTATSGTKKNCVKGYSCGFSCINRARSCANPLDGQSKTFADYLKAQTPKATKPKKAKTEKPKPAPEPQKAVATPTKSSFASIKPPKNPREEAKLEKELDSIKAEAKRLFESNKALYGDNYGVIESTSIDLMMDSTRFRGVRDDKGNIQAMASVRRDGDALKVEYLATSPWNVQPGDERYTRGAGSAMMEQIALEAVRGGNIPVKLEALPGAIGFYEKVGFSNQGQAEGYSDGVVNMTLSPDAARAFLQRRGVTNFEQSDEEWNAELEELELQANGAFAGGRKKKKST